MWRAKEAVRELYAHRDPDLALQWVTELSRDLQDKDYPIEARSLGRTLKRWKHQIAAWHAAQVSNGLTETVITWRGQGGVSHVATDRFGPWRRHVLWSGVSGIPDVVEFVK